VTKECAAVVCGKCPIIWIHNVLHMFTIGSVPKTQKAGIYAKKVAKLSEKFKKAKCSITNNDNFK